MESEFQAAFQIYSKEADKLLSAYENLQKQFFDLKEKFETSLQTLEGIISHMSDGFLFITQTGNITHFNRAAEELTGISQSVVINRSFWDHFDDSLFGFSMKGALRQSDVRKRIFITLSEEREIEVSTSSVPQKGILLLLSNRKERQALERSLEQTERLQELGEMAATLAHEIRNPLGGIEGFAQLLKRDLESQTHQRMIGAILEGTHALNKLVAQVLDYSRPLQLHFRLCDLVELIEGAVALMQQSVKTACFHFTSEINPCPLLLDSGQIQLVLLNLLRNAAEAKASSIEIRLSSSGTLVISDNGEGISAQNLKKIFSPFFTTKTNGTGLGLAQAVAIIKAHGGKVDVSSEEGKGTQFTLRVCA